jgi:hypothetical protein
MVGFHALITVCSFNNCHLLHPIFAADDLSLYLAVNLLVEKSIHNGPASSTPLTSSLGVKVLLAFASKSK